MSTDRYRIRQILGEGAASTVYLAHDTVENVDVAIKSQPHPQTQEYAILSKLSHEHIVRLKNFIVEERKSYLVLERCDSNLISFMNSHDVDMRCIKKIMRMVLLGIKYLHDSGVIHRDIKLGNILVKDDTVKICDMGLSCRAGSNDFSYCGTKDYLAPEIIRCRHEENGGPTYDSKVDIYAAGVVFKVLLSRKKDAAVEDMVHVGDDVRRFLEGLLRASPGERLTAEDALRDRVFGGLFADVPDFRMVRGFCKRNKYGEIRREDNYAQIRCSGGEEGSSTEIEKRCAIRIEYDVLGCSCKGEFVWRVRVNDVLTDRCFLTNSQLKYFNYVCSYLRILCEKTPKLRIAERGFSFTCFVDGSFLYASDGLRIQKAGAVRHYLVNNEKADFLPAEHRELIGGLVARYEEASKGCLCLGSALEEQGSTINLSIGSNTLAREYEFIKGVGWAVKSNLRFVFLLNDGSRFAVNARQQVLEIGGRCYCIDGTLPEGLKRYLRASRLFLQAFCRES